MKRSRIACRFHGRAWSKTCSECAACLDAGAGPQTIRELTTAERAAVDRAVRRFFIQVACIVAVAVVVLGIAFWTLT